MSAHGIGVSIQRFEARQRPRGAAEVVEPLRRDLLDRDALDEVRHAEATVGAGVAVGGQHVVGAAAVVAHGLGRPRTQEHGAGIAHLAEPVARSCHLQDQVLRSVAVAHLEGGVEIRDQQHAALGHRARGDRAARQGRHLPLDLGDARHGHGARRGDEHDLRVLAVLGLRQQVRGDEGRARGLIGDDQDFRRAGRHVERGSVGIRCDDLLGGSHPRVARTEDLVHLRHALGAEGHGGYGLCTAELEVLLDAAEPRRDQHGRVGAAVRARRRAHDSHRAAGNAGRHGQHDGRGR
jgi:hypothetical protein